MRANGYYWIFNSSGIPEVAEWEDGAWYFCGVEEPSDSQLDVIDGPLDVPSVAAPQVVWSERKVAPAPAPKTCSDDASDALELCDRVLEKCDEMPERGEDFAESVREKAESIREWIEEHGEATAAQLTALENMEAGLDRWLERG